jgi:hypothetical protein
MLFVAPLVLVAMANVEPQAKGITFSRTINTETKSKGYLLFDKVSHGHAHRRSGT